MPRTEAQNLAILRADVDALADAMPETPLGSLPNWDSLAILLTISHFEHAHGTVITAAQIRGCRTVRDLLAHIPR
jgi:acyl carrier protein